MAVHNEVLQRDASDPATFPGVDENGLLDLIRGDENVVPFLGAGMALRAGAPTVWTLASELATAAGVSGVDLGSVVAGAEAKIGVEDTRVAVAEIISCKELAPDSRLLKLAQWPAQRILTTNYDNAIEIAGRAAGLDVRTLGVKDADALTLESDVVKVIHLHGHVADPSSIVLPGATTEALAGDDVFLNQVRAMMEQGTVLYLGFSFAPAEVHLRGVLHWLAQIQNARSHLLVLPDDGLADREADLAELRRVPQVTVASYGADHGHTFLEVVSSVHARRSDASGRSLPVIGSRASSSYVEPALVVEGEGEGLDDLQGKVWGAEGGWGAPFVPAREMTVKGRALLLGQPGMGKTEALRQLARASDRHDSVLVSATDLAVALGDGEVEARQLSAVAQAISRGTTGREETVAPDLDALTLNSYLLLLDDFDLVDVAGREAVIAAVLAACRRWPQHRWVIASRPCIELAAFSDGGFERYRILPSEAWGHQYLRKRGVADPDIDWLTTRNAGFGAVMGIPLFAAAAADRLLADGGRPETPLDLLVDTQRDAADREARRSGQAEADWWIWLRRLAVGLELRSRTEASTAELAAVPGRGGLAVEEIREPLIRASLLVELPDRAAFPRRTLQEALCASAILESTDPLARIAEVGVGEVAGERHIRADLDFTLDLVFESASRDLRRRLRATDEERWALTVLARGSAEDAGVALDLLIQEAERRAGSLSMYAPGLRSPLQAVRSIVGRWPDLVADRRERLLGELESPADHGRFNALWILSAQSSDQDPAWLPGLIEDESTKVSLLAAETAASWRVRDAIPALEAVVGRPGSVHLRKRFLGVLLKLAEGREERLRIVASLLGDGPLFGESASEIHDLVDLDGYLELLGRRTHDSRIWEWLLDRALEVAVPEDWTVERVETLVEAVIAHDGDPRIGRDQRLVVLIEAHLETALAAARRALYHRPPAYRGLAMFAGVTPDVLTRDENAAIVDGAKKALAPEELAGWHRDPPRDWRAIALARLEDPEVDPAFVLEPETHWRVEEMSDGERRRLAELAARHLPVGRQRHRCPALRAVSDGSTWPRRPERGGAARPSTRPGTLDATPSQSQRPRNGPGALRLAAPSLRPPSRSGDPRVRLRGRGRRWVVHGDRRDTLECARPAGGDRRPARRRCPTDVKGWSNAVGLLAERGDEGFLRRLAGGERTEIQARVVRSWLARLGDVTAQLEVLAGLVETARNGEMEGEPPRWAEPIEDSSVLDSLGDLLEALGPEGKGSSWWDFALGKLASSPNPQALSVVDHIIESLEVPLGFTRLSLARQLAADVVLARLPKDIGDAAMLLEGATPDQSRTGGPR